MYTKATLISALAGLAAAAPAPRSTDQNVFEAVSLRSGSPIQAGLIQANGNHFFVNQASSASCPAGVPADCSTFGNDTFFAFGAAGNTLGLNVVVPGGQQVYVESNGALGYTIPHSAAIPEGAVLTPFEYTPQASEGSVGNLKFNGNSFSACPTGGKNDVGADIYQIFAAGPNHAADCLGINIGTATVATAKPVWEF